MRGPTRYSDDPNRALALEGQFSKEFTMGKNLILWMLGVPVSVLILLNVFGVV